MSRVRLLLLLGMIGLPLAGASFTPVSAARPETPPDLSGRWRVQTVVFNGEPSLPHGFTELVFTDRTVEYVAPQPVVADVLDVS